MFNIKIYIVFLLVCRVDLPAGTKLELPLWFAGTLHEKQCVELQTPKVYTGSYRHALSADAQSVALKVSRCSLGQQFIYRYAMAIPYETHNNELKDWNTHYFDVGMRFSVLSRNPELAAGLHAAFGDR